MKLTSISLNRLAAPPMIFAMLQNEKGESVNVHVHLEAHHNMDHLTVEQIEKMAHEAAKKLHP